MASTPQLAPSDAEPNDVGPNVVGPNLIGERLGAYQLIARLEETAFYTAYKGYYRGGYDYVLVKVLKRLVWAQAGFQQRFDRLPDRVCRLDHTGIATLYDQGVQDEAVYLVTEFVDGVSLAEELAARRAQRSPFSTAEVVSIVTAVGQAIDYAHERGLSHAHLNDESILFTLEGFPVVVNVEMGALLGLSDRQGDINALKQVAGQMLGRQVPEAYCERASEFTQALHDRLGAPPPTPRVTTIAQTRMEKQITAATDTAGQFKAQPGVCPYQGLFAFREENAMFFFGRETFVDQLVNLVQRKPIVMVTGSSGSGKSSVVYAGLVPYLRQSGTWAVVDFRPGQRPLRALAGALSPLVAPDIEPSKRKTKNHRLARRLHEGQSSLSELVTQILANTPPARQMLLVIDQFEELYTLCTDDALRSRFLDILVEASSAPAFQRQLTIVLTLRADFLSPVLAHRGFADRLHRADIKLGPMNPGELMRAIENPAVRQSVTFEEGLVKRILRDIGSDVGALPLLQFALTQLWGEQTEGRLTHQAYEMIDGATGALARYADLVYEGLDDTDQAKARRVFTQMVRPGTGTEDTRRLAFRAELNDADWQLVQQLADARLVVIGRTSDGQETVEVVHEALIREWQTLRWWLNEDRAFRTWQERLRTALHQWETSGKDDGALLRGALLAEAKGWLDDRPTDLSPLEYTFIRDSLLLHKQHKARERQTERFKENMRRAIFSTLALGLVLATLLAVFSWQQWQVAKDQQVKALSNQLAAQALSRLEAQEYDLAHLLSLEAYHLLDSVEARSALLASLQRSPYRSILRHYDNPILETAYSADGSLLVTLDATGRIELTNTETRQVLVCLPDVHTGQVTAISLSTDDRLLVSADDTGQITLWDLTDRTAPTVQRQIEQYEAVSAVLLSPDGQTVAAGGSGEITLWSLANEEPTHLVSHTGDVTSLAFSPNGRWLVSGSVNSAWAAVDEIVMLWDLDAEVPHGHQLTGLTDNVHDIAFSADGRLVAASAADGKIMLWNVETQQAIDAPLHHTVEEQSTAVVLPQPVIALSPDGKTLASGDVNGTIILWDLATSRPARSALRSHTGPVNDLDFSRDGHTLISATNQGTVVLWAVDQQLGESLSGTESRVWSLSFDPTAQDRLIIGNEDGSIVTWQLEPTPTIEQRIQAHPQHVNSVVVNPLTGATLVSSSDDGTIRLWDAASSDPLAEPLMGHTTEVLSVAFSPDGRMLASSSRDDTVILWDMQTYQPNGDPLTGHADDVWQVAFSANGRTLASASWDGTIRLWDVATGQPLGPPLAGHDSAVVDIATSPTDPLLASIGRDGRLLLWDLQTGELAKSLWQGAPGAGWRVTFSPDGQLLASSGCARLNLRGDCELGEVRLWDVAAGRQLGRPFEGHQDVVWAIDFTPSGDRLASGSRDGTVIVWDTNLDSWIHRACDIADRSLTPAEWQLYLGDEDYAPTCH